MGASWRVVPAESAGERNRRNEQAAGTDLHSKITPRDASCGFQSSIAATIGFRRARAAV